MNSTIVTSPTTTTTTTTTKETEIYINSNSNNNIITPTITTTNNNVFGSIDKSGSKSEESFQSEIIRNSSSSGDTDEISIENNSNDKKTIEDNNSNNNNNSSNSNSNKVLLESPNSSSSGSSVSSSVYQPIIRDINQIINPPTLNLSTDQLFKPEALLSNLHINDINNNNVNINHNQEKESDEDDEDDGEIDDEINKIVNSIDNNNSTNSNIISTTLLNNSDETLTEIDLKQSIIINNNLNRTLSPLYSSIGPDVRDSVNGFPLKISHLRIKEFQWLKHIKNYTQDNTITPEISKLVRLGIPRRIRGYVWRFFSGAIELERKNIGVYQHFLSKSTEEYEYKITKDISRTFPNNPDYNTEEGQNSLFRILKAYAIMDPEIGYTQGMSFIVATLLSEMDEVESFWAFTSIMKNYKLSSLYCNDLSLLRQYLYVIDRLIETTNPKLFSHLKEIGVTPVLFASEWISTLFTYNFDFKISKRLLDAFFIEGRFYLHKMAIAILKNYEKQLINFTFEDAVEFLKKLGTQIEPDTLFKTADSLPITEKMIMDFEEEFVHPNAPSDYF